MGAGFFHLHFHIGDHDHPDPPGRETDHSHRHNSEHDSAAFNPAAIYTGARHTGHGMRTEGSIFVFGENLTDEDYEYRIGYPMPGRMIQVGLEIDS